MDNISSIMENNTSITLSCFNESEAGTIIMMRLGVQCISASPTTEGQFEIMLTLAVIHTYLMLTNSQRIRRTRGWELVTLGR